MKYSEKRQKSNDYLRNMQSLVCFIIIYSYLCTRMKTTIIIERLQSALIAILFITVFLPFGLNHFGWMSGYDIF